MAGTSGGDDDDIITAINVTPLVDIILVLLIIFMVTTEVVHEQERPRVIPVDLPAAASAEEMLSAGLMSLVLDGTGTLWIGDQRSDYAGLQRMIDRFKARGVTPQAIISADRRIAYGDAASLMNFLRLNGVTKLALNTKKQEIE